MAKWKVIFNIEVEAEGEEFEDAIANAQEELNEKISQGEFFVSDMDCSTQLISEEGKS